MVGSIARYRRRCHNKKQHVRETSGGGTGDALLAGIGSGELGSSIPGRSYFGPPTVMLPNPLRVEGYNRCYKLYRHSAESNGQSLQEILAVDEGARSVGEFGIGTNCELNLFSNDILYDEKIHGTVHITLGRSSGASSQASHGHNHRGSSRHCRNGSPCPPGLETGQSAAK